MNRKRVILGALLGVLAICVVYAYLATPRLEKAPPRAADQRKQPAEKSPEVDEKESRGRIDFAYLTLEPQEFTGAQRDIFRFGRRPWPSIEPVLDAGNAVQRVARGEGDLLRGGKG